MRRRTALLVLASAAAAACVVLAKLVDQGRLAHFDQYSVMHWMPWLEPPVHRHALATLAAPEHRHSTWGEIAALTTYPASAAISAAIVLVAAAVAWQRGRRNAALVICAAWVASNVIEVVGKHEVTRPRLHQTNFGHHGYLPALSHSLPSGHTMRAFVVAAALTLLGRFGLLAYAWALAVCAALVLIGDHTPTDVLAGMAAGAALVAVVHAVAEPPRRSNPPKG